MKNILAFGDSLTWGSNPHTDGRHSPADRFEQEARMAMSVKLFENETPILRYGSNLLFKHQRSPNHFQSRQFFS